MEVRKEIRICIYAALISIVALIVSIAVVTEIKFPGLDLTARYKETRHAG